jgi:hypothetical protein
MKKSKTIEFHPQDLSNEESSHTMSSSFSKCHVNSQEFKNTSALTWLARQRLAPRNRRKALLFGSSLSAATTTSLPSSQHHHRMSTRSLPPLFHIRYSSIAYDHPCIHQIREASLLNTKHTFNTIVIRTILREGQADRQYGVPRL